MRSVFLLALLFPVILHTQTAIWPWEELTSSIELTTLHSIASDSIGDMAVGYNRGIVVSNDRGRTWRVIPLDKGIGQVEASRDGFFLGLADSSLYQSLNRGENWEKVYQDPYRRIEWIKVLPGGEGLMKPLNANVLISTDKGRTWNDMVSRRGDIHELAMEPGGVLWGIADYTIYSLDSLNGAWHSHSGAPERMEQIAIDRNGRIVVAGPSGIWQSVDAGKSWGKIGTGLNGSAVDDLAPGADGVFFAATGEGLYMFDPAGKSWKLTSLWDGGVLPEIHALLSVPEPGGSLRIYGTSDYKAEPGSAFLSVSSDNGVTWEEAITNRFSASNLGPVVISSDGVLLANSLFEMENPSTQNQVLLQRRLWRSTDNGAEWQTLAINTNLNGPYRSAKGDLLVIDNRTRILRSSDNGDTWRQTADTFATPVSNIRVAPDGRMYALSYNYLYRSTDDGEHWDTLPKEFYTIYDYAIGPNGLLGVATEYFWYISTDYGATWEMFGAPETDPSWEHIESIGIAPNGAILLTMYLGGVWRKENPDAPLQKVAQSVYEKNVFATDSANGFYMGSTRENNVWYSTDNGLTWTLICVNGGSNIAALDDGNIYIGTKGMILRSPVPAPTSTPDHADLSARRFGLMIVPNPSTDAGIVTFTLSHPDRVRIELLDGAGFLRHILLEASLSQGEHHLALPEDIPPGAYIVRLCAAEGCETIKGIVVR